MKHRQIINLLTLSLPICVLLRTIQILFTIDATTGFIKQQYRDICTLITLVIFAAIGTMCILSCFTENIAVKNTTRQPAVAVAAMLTGGVYLYEMFSSILKPDGLYGILLIFLSMLSAIIFIGFGIEKIHPYNFPSIMLVIPTVFYVVKLIKLFVSTSSLSLVTENVFLLFSNSSVLWFAFEFASYENNFGNSKKAPKTMFACGITSTMLCVVSALPKLFLLPSQLSTVSAADLSSALLMLSQVVFMLSYIISNFCPKEKRAPIRVSKHS